MRKGRGKISIGVQSRGKNTINPYNYDIVGVSISSGNGVDILIDRSIKDGIVEVRRQGDRNS